MLLGLEGVQIRVDLVSIDIEVELLSVMPEARKLALFYHVISPSETKSSNSFCCVD